MDDDGTPLSLVGIGSPRNKAGDELWLSNARAGIAHMDDLPVGLRHEVDRFVLSEVRRLATDRGALRIDWESPSMSRGPEALIPALTEFGYRCDIWPSRVLDLKRDEDALWRDYRKGCKSAIRRAQKLGVTVQDVVDESGVTVFADLHARRMRSIGAPSSDPDVFMEMWRLLAPLGQCEILLASLPSGLPVAGIALLSYRNMVYYHAACSDPDHMESGGNTLLVHEAVLRSKARGAALFHVGPSPLESQASEKAYLVGRFKNQFGGQRKAWVVASLVVKAPSLPVSEPDPPPAATRSHIRRVASATLPPGAKRWLRDLRLTPCRDSQSAHRDGLFGDFPDWESALTASKPYQTDLAVYAEITDRVRQGRAGSGRNLMPILAGIAMTGGNGATRVLDFGGSLGVLYFDVARVVSDRISEWRVVDGREVVSYGDANYADDKLSFFTSLEAACRDFVPDMVLCSHTLQYLEDPYDTLAMLSALAPTVIVLHELPVAERERFMIQRLPEELGGTERPVRILSAHRLAAALSSYDLLADTELRPRDPHIDARHAAQVYRRRPR